MDTFLANRGNYKGLIAYQKAECIYDITFYFAHTFLQKGDRTIDQMVQAARSGKQNIAEGSTAAATSTETEIKLTNVAKASLQELLVDYEDYLRQHNLCQWQPQSEKARQAAKACRAHSDSAYYRDAITQRSDETIANIAITLIHQTDYLLERLLQAQQHRFLHQGGIREQMSAARRAFREQAERAGRAERTGRTGSSGNSGTLSSNPSNPSTPSNPSSPSPPSSPNTPQETP